MDLMLKSTQLLSSSKARLRNAAVNCLSSLLQPASIANWDASNIKAMSTFWKIANQVFRDVFIQAFQVRENEELLKQLLELMNKILINISQFMLPNQVC
jgi:hypothetical protein